MVHMYGGDILSDQKQDPLGKIEAEVINIEKDLDDIGENNFKKEYHKIEFYEAKKIIENIMRREILW